MVTFIAGDDGAVSASGSFIFNENFKTESAEAIEQFFDGISVEVQEIEKWLDMQKKDISQRLLDRTLLPAEGRL